MTWGSNLPPDLINDDEPEEPFDILFDWLAELDLNPYEIQEAIVAWQKKNGRLDENCPPPFKIEKGVVH